MRTLTIVLAALLALVQAQLWLGKNGVPRVVELSSQVAAQHELNEQARTANVRLTAEVRDLQEGLEIIEEKARSELGMIKPDEILVQYAAQATRRPATAAPDSSR
jgi:cell division protein FtsB